MKRTADAFIFDLDGTLVDSMQDLHASVNYTREQLGMDILDFETAKSFVGDGARMLVARAIESTDKAVIDSALEKFKGYYGSHFLDNTELYPGVLEILENFADKPMGIVSNKPVLFTQKILEGLKIDRYFGVVIGPEQLTQMKPHPEGFEKVIVDLKVKSESTIVVGDRWTDISGGNDAGAVTVGVRYGLGDADELNEYRPDYLIDSILELKDIFV